MPKVHFVSPLQDLTVDVAPGTTVLEAAEACGAQVGHVCGGVCACSTCHVYVKRGLGSLSAQEEDEMDRLDQAFDVKPSSRLACQSVVDGEDLEVFITEESLVAYLDENPDARRKLISEGKWPVRK